ncbi:MAG: polysaccharide biosynthesis/export family protein [Planctomycetota bacterium]
MNASFPSKKILVSLFLCILCGFQSGCVTTVEHAVPAARVPQALLGQSRSGLEPIDLSLLQQRPPSSHLIGPGDILGVYVYGIIPPQTDQSPILNNSGAVRPEYFPAGGAIRVPTVGLPLEVQSDGSLPLPLVGSIEVSGMTVKEAADKVRSAYEKEGVIQENRDRSFVTLMRSRTYRVTVMREDAPTETPVFLRKDTVPYTKIGRGQVIDLPAFENDVLHALAGSGGLPGLDAWSRVWIFRSANSGENNIEANRRRIAGLTDPEEMLHQLGPGFQKVCIPLRLPACSPPPFTIDDVILNDGDIVYLEPRERDFFYTGGLLPGGRVPLPRDHDIDVVEAVALANGSVGGPGGVSGVAVFRAGAGPGQIIPPTRVLILRKVRREPNIEQVAIRVDLTRAMRDPSERIRILPDDVVMLSYKPSELAGNVFLNLVNLNYAIPNN